MLTRSIKHISAKVMLVITFALLMVVPLIAIIGCSTTMSKDEAKAHEAASVAQAKRAEADKAKSDAIATLAAGTGSAERVAGIMALVMSGQSSAQAPQVIQSRRSTTEVFIDGLLRFLGLGVQYHGIEAGKDVSIQASRDRAATDQAAFSALADVAGKIQAPQANQSTTNNNATTFSLSANQQNTTTMQETTTTNWVEETHNATSYIDSHDTDDSYLTTTTTSSTN